MKCIYILSIVILGIAGIYEASAAGECPNSTPDAEAMKLYPCASAAQDVNAAVSTSCCAQVKRMVQNPKCMCAVMLSDTAKSSGVNPEIALSIPKRCNLANRPVGYKCGGYPFFILFFLFLHTRFSYFSLS